MGLEDLILPAAGGGAIAGVAAVLAGAMYARFCVRVPPHRAAVLYGRRGVPHSGETRGNPPTAEITRPRIVVGGRAFVAPWDRGVGYLSLHPVTVDLTVRSLYSLEGSRASGWEARISLQAKIPSDPDLLSAAAENLLGKSEGEVRALVRHTVEGAVPAVLARLRPGDREPDWEQLASEIQASVASDLVAYGLVVRTLSITELVRIASGEGILPSVRSAPTATLPAVADTENLDTGLPPLEVRLSRVERSLGIMGAEIVRIVREGLPWRGESDPASVLDIPLGFEGPDAAALRASGETTVHDSIGGDRSPRSRLPSREGTTGEGGDHRRPLLDAERER